MAVRVLYIEDEEFFGKIILQRLNKMGFDAVLAKGGEDAFAALDTQEFGAILLDLLLPGMDGFEILKKIKETPRTKDIPVIVLSNLDTKADREKARELGAAEFLVKVSTNPKDIGVTIANVLAAHQK